MPRYFFDTHDDVQALSDTEGELFASPDDAGKRAAYILSEIALHSPSQNGCSNLLALVRNEAGYVVFTATLSIVGRRIDTPIVLPGCHVGAKKSRRSKLPAA